MVPASHPAYSAVSSRTLLCSPCRRTPRLAAFGALLLLTSLHCIALTFPVPFSLAAKHPKPTTRNTNTQTHAHACTPPHMHPHPPLPHRHAPPPHTHTRARVHPLPPLQGITDDTAKLLAKKQAGRVQGTDADLRRMTTEQAKQRLLEFGLEEEVINAMGRWQRIDAVRGG